MQAGDVVGTAVPVERRSPEGEGRLVGVDNLEGGKRPVRPYYYHDYTTACYNTY